jgi:RimJ/RimL family protein N-acetyltransferase
MFSADDVPAYASFCSDPEVMRFIGAGEVQPPEMTWRSVAGMLGQWQLRGYGMWALALRSTGELIGRVGFIDPPGWPGFELGWLLGRQYWGNGYAREGAAAALQQAHGTLGKQRVISLIRPGNTRSAALLLLRAGQHSRGHCCTRAPAPISLASAKKRAPASAPEIRPGAR